MERLLTGKHGGRGQFNTADKLTFIRYFKPTKRQTSWCLKRIHVEQIESALCGVVRMNVCWYPVQCTRGHLFIFLWFSWENQTALQQCMQHFHCLHLSPPLLSQLKRIPLFTLTPTPNKLCRTVHPAEPIALFSAWHKLTDWMPIRCSRAGLSTIFWQRAAQSSPR